MAFLLTEPRDERAALRCLTQVLPCHIRPYMIATAGHRAPATAITRESAALDPTLAMRYSSFQIGVWEAKSRKYSPWLSLALTPPSPRGRGA
jgi:hypothetical protein